MTIHYGMFQRTDPDYADLNDAIAAGAREAFLADKDGQGYVQEIAIPWKLITRDGHALKAGDTMSLTIGVNWGSAAAARSQGDYVPPEHRYVDLINPDNPQREFIWNNDKAWGTVKFLPRGKLVSSPSIQQLSAAEEELKREYSTEGPVALRYQMPCDGGATLAIEKPDGTRVRNLIGDYPRQAGPQVDFWDGTADDGHLVEPGTYRVRGLCHGPLDLLYEFAYGNPGNPPYQNAAGTGGWLANHDNPFAVAADQERIYVAAPQSEGATTLLAVDGTWPAAMGTRQHQRRADGAPWKVPLHAGRRRHVPSVRPGRGVARHAAGPGHGKYVPFADGKYSHKIAEFPADMAQLARLQAAAARGRNRGRPRLRRRLVHAPEHGPGSGRRPALCLASTTRTRSWWSTRSNGEAVGQIPLQRPAGLAADAHRHALCHQRPAGDEDRAGRPADAPRAPEGLSAPVGLATDREGNLYVSDWGAAMCVQVFSPQGKPLAHHRTRGRPAACRAPTIPRGMFRPWGLAVDRQDRLWVAEYDAHPAPHQRLERPHRRVPPRVLRHDVLRGGRGLRQCELNPRQAFVMGNTCELDWEKGLWRVTGTLFRETRPEALFGLSHEGLKLEVVRHQGRDLLIGHRNAPDLHCRAWARRAPDPWRPWAPSPFSGPPDTHGPTWS